MIFNLPLMLTATYYTAPVLKRNLIHINEPLRIYAYYSRKLTIIAIYDITDISEPYLLRSIRSIYQLRVQKGLPKRRVPNIPSPFFS